MRLLVTRRMTAEAEAAIAAAFDATFRDDAAPLTEAEAAAALSGYDGIMPTLGDGFTAAAFAAAGVPRTRVLANFGAGHNHIDVAAAAAAGVVVTNTPDVVTDATADIALTLILMTARRAGEGERLVRAGQWPGWQPTQMLGMHVTGRTVGIIGMGRIGQAVARRCHFGFGMTVVFHNRSTLRGLDVPARQMPLNAVLAGADIVVLAVPGGGGTRHLIGAAQLAAMRRHAILVNVARGDVIDEAALIAALDAGAIAGAGLDVYEREPLVPQALRQRDDVVLLPHLGTAARQVRTDMAMRALSNLIAVRDGLPPPDRVGNRAQGQTLSATRSKHGACDMNWDVIQGKWDQIKGSVKEQWGDLTDDELTQASGSREKMAGKLQEKYGWTKTEVDEKMNDFFKRHL